ncbi:MAG: hypothetical protein Q8L04_15745 [Ignavibacteria bacterium]|nr:hypothetical protein [Ignavibacteria bacterium]
MCFARKPQCHECVIAKLCPSFNPQSNMKGKK